LVKPPANKPVRRASIADLTRGASSVTPLAGVGFSNATLSTVVFPDGRYVLKVSRLSADWTARRTNDVVGREALLLDEPLLQGVWDVITCPYVAYATQPDQVGLLMDDLSSGLLPDVREPLSREHEDTLLGTLARLHARFWDSEALDIDWLVTPAQYCDILAPQVAGDPAVLAVLSTRLRDGVPRGWASALPRLPDAAASMLERPGTEWQTLWSDLPHTLLHGDVKIANFAILAEDSGSGEVDRSSVSVAAFDWATAGAGPCAIDLGWYLAVNASRLAGSKESVIARYRAFLETALANPIDGATWARLESVAVVCGARMLLWSKALALDEARPGAAEEWRWWVDRLAAIQTG
jgi:hypothetical protein